MKTFRNISILVAFLAMAGCNGNGLFSGGNDKDTASGGGGGGDESADNPVNVNGTYLTCAFINEANETNRESNLGCAVKNKSDQKIKLADISLRWEWTYDISEQDRKGVVIVANKIEDESQKWHVIYNFKGSDASLIRQVAAVTHVQAKVIPKKGGNEITAFDTPVGTVATNGTKVEATQAGKDGIFNEGSQQIDTNPITDP